ncbi:nitroreductase family protein [Candidatus Woesearchaeota archaeon]|nr:nitroreductase family protein [Candidatus Woesearchaeota archaeon]
MGDILDIITSRRTIKRFLPKYVSWENIAKLIDAARHAPSAGNIQNWKFIIVIDQELKENIAKACYEQYEITAAGAFIVVCAEPEKGERYYGSRGEKLYTIQNCAAAVQNMLLEAHALGLGTQWIGAFEEEEVKSLLKIPEEVRPQAIIVVGYPQEIPPKPPKYPLETLIYFNSWRSKMRDPAKYMNDIATILARKANTTIQVAKESAHLVVDKAKEKITARKAK